MKFKKWYILPLLAIIAVVIYFVAKKGDAKVEASTFTPRIEKAIKGDIRVEVSATGIIQPINKIEIKSKASGLIEEMPINASDAVKKGDLIALLDQRDTKNAYDQSVAELEAAQATVEQRQSDFNRKKELFEKGLISQTEYDQAKLTLVDAKAAVVRARVNLDNNDIRLKDTVVRAPITGIILTKDVEAGQIISSGISSVSGGTLIATIAEMSKVYVKADVDEVDIGRIQPGMSSRVVADAYPDEVFRGQVIRIAAQGKVVQSVTTFEVTIEVDNPNERLKAGMNASVDILIADHRDVVLIANEALMSQRDLMTEFGKFRALMAANAGASQGEAFARSDQGQGMRRPGGGMGQGRNRNMSQDEQSPESRLNRGVILKMGDQYRPQMVKAGVSNFDYTEILDGLKEGDEVAYSFISRAQMASERDRQRMLERASSSSGFRSTTSSNTR